MCGFLLGQVETQRHFQELMQRKLKCLPKVQQVGEKYILRRWAMVP